MSVVSITSNEVFESLTGFDEVAICKWFEDIGALAEAKGSMLGRALVFIVKRREGLSDVEAHAASMALPLRDLNKFFVDSDEESAESAESGKDSPPSEPPPEDLPTSA